MTFEAVVIRTDRGQTVYAPAIGHGGGLLAQPYVEGANSLNFSLASQIASAEYYGFRPLYIVRAKARTKR